MKTNRIIIALFLCFIGSIACMHAFLKDVYFSEVENRVLTEMPKFTFQRVLSGDFTQEDSRNM